MSTEHPICVDCKKPILPGQEEVGTMGIPYHKSCGDYVLEIVDLSGSSVESLHNNDRYIPLAVPDHYSFYQAAVVTLWEKDYDQRSVSWKVYHPNRPNTVLAAG